MKFIPKILIISFLLLSITSCKPKVEIENDKGDKIELKIESIELTSSEKENEENKIIFEKVDEFLATNKSDVVLNYLFLCDSLRIETIRDFSVVHKESNITIGLGKKDVRLTPIPSSYKVAEGPFALYKIYNDSLGKFASYFLDLNLDEDYNVTTFKGTLRFMKEKNGVNRLSFMKEINPEDNYQFEERIKENRW